MNVYINAKFDSCWPIGSAAVVVANTKREALKLLNIELRKCGLPETNVLNEFVRLKIDKPQAKIIIDDDYWI